MRYITKFATYRGLKVDHAYLLYDVNTQLSMQKVKVLHGKVTVASYKNGMLLLLADY